METISQVLWEAAREDIIVRIILGGKRKKTLEYNKISIRPVTIKGENMYQAEFHFDKKVTHRNISKYELYDFVDEAVANDFKQVNIMTENEDIQILASKPAKPRITRHPASRPPASRSHNKQKNYFIEDGVPCDFLIRLGVMSADGHVVARHYSKFRQINRFLEIADDSFEHLPKEGTLRIIDFGCGKSYLTFALYYYLRIVQNRDVEIIGLDLKEDVIEFCNGVARDLGYDKLRFLIGDIADYKSDGADMVVTLHACDTATDFALINAVGWNSKVILSVPCCQHEMFSQIKCDVDEPLLKHGIIKDKFTELLTDGLRGLKLESKGYNVNMIEFTSLEHTSKNIMIKAVLQDNPGSDAAAKSREKALQEYNALKLQYTVKPTIDLLK